MSQSHSPLGFSGAERWTNCPGSVALIASLPPNAGEGDPEYRKAGTAAHAVAAACLNADLDAWESVGSEHWGDYTPTAEDLASVQDYLDVARGRIAALKAEGNAFASAVMWVEREIRAPEIHELAYGTLDLALVAGDYAEVIDYKHGEGIWVDAERNMQLMGYGCLLLRKFPFVKTLRLGIVQPRCAPYDGPRWFEIGAADLGAWRDRFLIPAMRHAAATDGTDLKPGSWCRFCRAKEALACPALEDNAIELHDAGKKWIDHHDGSMLDQMTSERLGDLYQKIEPMQIMAKAVAAEVLRRRLTGIDVPGSKTVAKKTFRVWKDTAKEAILAALGADALTTPDLKGPADVEKLSAVGKALVKEYAYSPDAGYAVAPLSDRRRAVTPPVQSSDAFDKFLDSPVDRE